MTDQPTDVEELAAALVSAKEQMEAAKSALDDAKRAYEQLEVKMVDSMQAADASMLKAGGRYVSVRTTHRWSVPKDHKDTVLELFKTHHPDIVKETVHAATLNKLADEMRTTDSPLPWWGEVDALLSMTSTTAVRVTKSKPKA